MAADVDYLHVLRFKTSTLIENPDEQEQFLKVIHDFLKNEDVKALVEGVKKAIDGQQSRLQFYDDVQRLVPPHLQMEYTLLVPYTSSRVRTVRLLRGLGSPVTGSATFGFSIRGGREHGTGFFVSEVCEETRAAGLRVGDQILRVNGYSVEHAIHQEVLKLIQDSNHLNLKVRSVGMIPVKDENGIETPSEDGSYSLNSLNGSISSETAKKIKPPLIRKQTPPALTLTEMAALKKMTGQQENEENHSQFQPQLQTIPAGEESPPPEKSDRRTDPLIWVPVNTEEDSVKPLSPSITTTTTDSLDQPPIIHSIDGVDSQHEIKHISIAARSKLDCSICKGPELHPGIFIQSTKEGGLAREAGLRPGDQIIQCNGINFEEISFSEAVNILKKEKNLNLVIRKGSGADLFPGESSGYNSSASSVNGDGGSTAHSPNGGCQTWNDDAKRLSIVREEVSDLVGSTKMQAPDGRVTLDKNKDWDEIEIEWEMADKQQSLVKNEINGQMVSFPSHFEQSEVKPVVNETEPMGEVTVKTQEVVAIVHRSEADEADGPTWVKEESVTTEIQQLTIPEAPAVVETHKTVLHTNSNSSVTSQTSTPSLSRALSLEIQKRAQKFGLVDDDSSDDISRKNHGKEDGSELKKDLLKEIGEEKRMQHSMLMEEFKKVHSKMFANSMSFDEDSQPLRVEDSSEQRHLEETRTPRSRRESHQNENEKREEKTDEHKRDEPKTEVKPTVMEMKKETAKVAPPPLPPPLPKSPSSHSLTNGWTKTEKKSQPLSPPFTLKKQSSFSRTSSSESITPKSPRSPFFSNDNNIQIIANGKPTDEAPKKQQQPQKGHVSVTISEYPSSNASRHVPTKMPIFEKSRPDWKKYVDPSSENKDNPAAQRDFKQLASQVQSELQQTLSRAKLKEQAEAPTDDKKQTVNNLLPGNTAVSRYLSQVYGLEKEGTPKPTATTHHNTDKILNALANKVTIRVPNSVSQAASKNSGN